MTSRALIFAGLIGIAALGCARATFHDIDGGVGGGGKGGTTGTGGRGDGGSGGSAGDNGETGGTGGTVIGGNGGGGAGGGGTGGSIGLGGRGGSGGTTGGNGGGGAGGGGRGGTGGAGGIAGAGGGGNGGGGTGGGRGGTGGTAGAGGVAGTTGGSGGGSGGTGGGPAGVMPTVAGQIVITELMHDVTGVEDQGEWFEVYNPSTTVTYDLMNCVIADVSGLTVSITTPFVMPPGSFKTLAISSSPGFTPDFVYGTTIKFDNDNADQASIRCGSVDIDTFAYAMVDAQMGTAHSFSLDPDHYSAADNDVRANWCLGVTAYVFGTSTDYGTPGAANPQCP